MVGGDLDLVVRAHASERSMVALFGYGGWRCAPRIVSKTMTATATTTTTPAKTHTTARSHDSQNGMELRSSGMSPAT